MNKKKILEALEKSERVIGYTLETLDEEADLDAYADATEALELIATAKKELK